MATTSRSAVAASSVARDQLPADFPPAALQSPNLWRRSGSWVGLFCLGLAAWLSASQLQYLHNGDSLLVSIISFTKWTPYFWRQNRYGMLWPLLCGWIQHPLYNLMAIMWCNVAAGLAAQFLLVRLLWRGRGHWQWAGLVSVLASFCLAPQQYLFDTLSPIQFITTPLALGCLALGAVELHGPTLLRLLVAVSTFAVVAWYNPAAPLMLGALLFWRLALTWDERPAPAAAGLLARLRLRLEDVLGFGLAAASLGCAMAMMRASRWHDPTFDKRLPWREWLDSAWIMTQKLFWRTGDDVGAPLLAIAVLVGALGVIGGAAWTRQPAGLGHLRRMVAGLGAASTYATLVASNAWARHEGNNVRYFLPALFVAVAAVSGGVANVLGDVVERRRASRLWPKGAETPAQQVERQVGGNGWTTLLVSKRWVGIAVVTLMTIVGGRFGPPSYAGLEAWMRQWAGETGEPLLAYDATHVAGRYWEVWPSVFYVNWQRYVHHDKRRIYAMTHRTDPTVPLWPADPRTWRIGLLKGSLEEAKRYVGGTGLQRLGFVVQAYGETPQLVLARPKELAQR